MQHILLHHRMSKERFEGARSDADREEPLKRSIMTLEGCGREREAVVGSDEAAVVENFELVEFLRSRPQLSSSWPGRSFLCALAISAIRHPYQPRSQPQVERQR